MRFDDLNPQGRILTPLLFAVAQRYSFIEHTKLEDLPHLAEKGKGIEFLRGAFLNSMQITVAVDLIIFNDAIYADTHSSTDDADDFLVDLCGWASREFGLSTYNEFVRSRLYVSELYVQTDKSLNDLNPQLTEFLTQYNNLVSGYLDRSISFETIGIMFGQDQALASPLGTFRFERALGTPFTENRYYSAANLKTNDHIKILDELERILGHRN